MSQVRGRPRGSVNRRTANLIAQLAEQKFDCVPELIGVITEMKQHPKLLSERGHLILRLMEFIYPKRKAIDLGDDDSTKQTFAEVMKKLSELATDK